ncbi:MAG: 4-hydroxyphenylacetate catabolism regulatory protein HpaA [Betaproteobacteria bacterium]|nr:4-hydroxyphenylacetate catabolism regulatory protein HpaA [Betaproteobacteria bacterium]
MEKRRAEAIPDIYVSRAYAGNDSDCEVHYETFGRLAEIFGRNTPPHRHSRFFQIHLLCSGSIRLELDEQLYLSPAPLVFLTPPAVPHAFYSEDGSDGHVITVRQEVVRRWYASMPGLWPEKQLRTAAFLPLGNVQAESRQELDRLMQLADLIQSEFSGRGLGRTTAVNALGLCFFISLNRLFAAQRQAEPQKRERNEDLSIFLQFCDLVEARFRDHLTLPEYAKQMAVTEARLNDVCRRMANLASKELVHDRLLQEARRLLRFSSIAVGELSYQLGFKDPAYFSRFFTRGTGLTPSQFRTHHQDQVR